MVILEKSRLDRIKTSFATRRVPFGIIHALDGTWSGYRPGDLVLARVEEIGQHTRIERPDGRRALLFPGDEIVLACGARYAPDQFEADCPTGPGAANMVAAGGIAGHVTTYHEKMKPATTIEILGVLRDLDGKIMNLADHAVPPTVRELNAPIIAVCGASMNSGKTHTVASIAHGFALEGKSVATIKITGTGAGGDLWFFRDAGAGYVADFTDAGFGTTYRVDPSDVLAGARNLIGDALNSGAERIVLEIADGLRQEETAAILQSPEFAQMVDAVVYACGDAMAAESGVAWLRAAGLPVRAVAGCITRSPLAMREASTVIDLPCLTPPDLWDGAATGSILLDGAQAPFAALVEAA